MPTSRSRARDRAVAKPGVAVVERLAPDVIRITGFHQSAVEIQQEGIVAAMIVARSAENLRQDADQLFDVTRQLGWSYICDGSQMNGLRGVKPLRATRGQVSQGLWVRRLRINLRHAVGARKEQVILIR